MIERRLSGEVGEIDELVGRKVKLMRSPGWRGQVRKCRESYTIDDVFFRISLDGKVICSVTLAELPGDIYTLSDILLLYEEQDFNKKTEEG